MATDLIYYFYHTISYCNKMVVKMTVKSTLIKMSKFALISFIFDYSITQLIIIFSVLGGSLCFYCVTI